MGVQGDWKLSSTLKGAAEAVRTRGEEDRSTRGE